MRASQVGRRCAPLLAAAAAAAAITAGAVRVAEACGCLSPPVPAPLGDEDYAVNQQAEQLIFEVEDGWVTAHVLIKYAGAPEQFAWIVPVPEVPELSLSPTAAFGLLDRATAPQISVRTDDLCPISKWQCRYHPPADCGDDHAGGDDGFGFADAAAGFSDAAPTAGEPPPVTVIDTQTVGDYQTVTFTAAEATAALQWLNDNGFIVNPTMAPYMQPYVDDGMVFVAAKLVPGASTATAIKPLRMRYRGPWPMIPLVLTAVAAEPHLTINAFVYSDATFRPVGHPVVTIDRARIARDAAGRINYPMVLARTVDEAGGDGFVVEYAGAPVVPQFGQSTPCCDRDGDVCGLGNNGQCECPRDAFDAADCEAEGELVAGIALLDGLAQRHTTLTRLTTRLSPEEMTFDPQFEPGPVGSPGAPLSISVDQPSLDGCEPQVLDQPRLRELDAAQACAATYCGRGQCVVTAAGPACQCDPEHVARRFVDSDGQPSVTCVPARPPVDLAAGGLYLPNACAGVSCGRGTCVDRNGVPTCLCAGGAAATVGTGAAPRCELIVRTPGGPGGDDWSEGLRDLEVCAPRPPSCGEHGWLVEVGSPRPGVACPGSQPTAAQLRVPDPPTCGGWSGIYGCGCDSGANPIGPIAGGLVVGLLVLRRRKQRA
ncbi:MAG TPA: DUF2330 domain-containing protein [Kofleriaceae bacterium]|nr:DUF2330 domain-containing protein [Kofleriaceae bacterium]